MSAPNVDFSPYDTRQQTSFNQDGSQYPNTESSDFDTPGSGYGSGVDKESSPM